MAPTLPPLAANELPPILPPLCRLARAAAVAAIAAAWREVEEARVSIACSTLLVRGLAGTAMPLREAELVEWSAAPAPSAGLFKESMLPPQARRLSAELGRATPPPYFHRLLLLFPLATVERRPLLVPAEGFREPGLAGRPPPIRRGERVLSPG